MKRTSVELLDKFIDNFNQKAKNTKDYPYRFSVKIGKFEKELKLATTPEELEEVRKKGLPESTKLFRTIRLYIESTEDNSREHIYQRHFVVSKASEFITQKEKLRESLCEEMLYYGFENLMLGLQKQRIAKEVEEDVPVPFVGANMVKS